MENYKPKIIETVSYNGEKELFEIRYNILKDYVDSFIVVEFDKTFSGQPKPWRFIEDFKGQKFKNVCYHRLEEKDYIKYKELAENSPNTKGAEHWKLEFMQKESIKDALLVHHLKDDDIVFISDCDEIWNPKIISPARFIFSVQRNRVYKLKLKVYTYFLNNRSSEEFYGTILGKWEDIKSGCLNHIRSKEHEKTDHDSHGWHFTSMHHQLEKKLKDSYTEEDYARPRVLSELEENIKKNRDFLGRSFTYKVDESEWPQWLKNNREEYLHLLK